MIAFLLALLCLAVVLWLLNGRFTRGDAELVILVALLCVVGRAERMTW